MKKSQRKTNITWYRLLVTFLKNELIYKTDSQRMNLGLLGGIVSGEDWIGSLGLTYTHGYSKNGWPVTLQYVLGLPYINLNPPWVYTCSPSWTPSLLPPCTIPLGRLITPAPSILYPASNLDWRFVSYMILYMFQCHSPKSSHPLPLPESPKEVLLKAFFFGFCLSNKVVMCLIVGGIF